MAARYRLDPGQSRFIVQGYATGMLSALAHDPTITVRDFTGELQITPDTFEPASFQMAVKADALDVTGNVKPQDRQEIETRMRQEVLEVARYPEVRYKSTAVKAAKITENWYRLQITGDLSLHGVTKALPVDAQCRIAEDELRLSGEFALLQSAFRIKRVTAVGGMITLKDELKLSFELVGRLEGS
jgi:polyisoprenoid-binding protein YceI